MRWIAADNPQAALRLRQAVAALGRHLGDHPLAGVRRPELAGDPYRFTVVRGFPYVVAYNADLRPPGILRIVHGAQNLPEVFAGLN